MYHSVNFGNKNTWDDWHLIPSSRPAVALPEAKSKTVEIPGRDGMLDISEILTGRPVYGDRSGSFSFIVDNGFRPWQVAYSDIANYLHGKRMTMSLEDDPEFEYTGRFKVGEWQTGKSNSGIQISYVLDPFKTSIQSSAEDWLWDTFSFETGVIREYKQLTVDGALTLNVIGSGQPTSPKFTVSGDGMIAQLRGETFSLPVGTNTIYGLVIQPGDNSIRFIGNGIVTIDYREVSL